MQPEKWHQEGIKYLNLNQLRKLRLSVLNVCGANVKEGVEMAASTCSLGWQGRGGGCGTTGANTRFQLMGHGYLFQAE